MRRAFAIALAVIFLSGAGGPIPAVALAPQSSFPDEQEKKQRKLRRQYFELGFQQADGVEFVPHFHALAKGGVLEHLPLSTSPDFISLEELVSRTKCVGPGYMGSALIAMAQQGWLEAKKEDIYVPQGDTYKDFWLFRLTKEGEIALNMLQSPAVRNAFDKSVAFIPYAKNMDSLLFSKKQDPQSKASERYAEIVALAGRDWNLPQEKDPERAKLRAQMLRYLNGTIVGPTMVALGMRDTYKRFDKEGVLNLRKMGGNRANLRVAFDLLAQPGQAWVSRRQNHVQLTSSGREALQVTHLFGVPVSYLPMMQLSYEMMFVNPSPPDRDKKTAEELLVNRKMNIWGSDLAHRQYFQMVFEVLKEIFDNDRFDEQPEGLMDVGCGRGGYLKNAYEYIRDHTKRGEMMKKDPEKYGLKVVGVDYNKTSLRGTAKALNDAGIPNYIMWGDILDPAAIEEKLSRDKGWKMKKLLQLSSMIHHDRPYKAPKKRTGLTPGKSRLIFADEDGSLIPSAELEQNTKEHFGNWAPYLTYGLVLIELCGIAPDIAARNLGITSATSYSETHWRQFIQEWNTVLVPRLKEIGILPEGKTHLRPRPDLVAVAVAHLKSTPERVAADRILEGIRAADKVRHPDNPSLKLASVALMELDDVGSLVLDRLMEEGAIVRVSDPNPDRIAAARKKYSLNAGSRFFALKNPEDIYDFDDEVEFLWPGTSGGGTLDEKQIQRLKQAGVRMIIRDTAFQDIAPAPAVRLTFRLPGVRPLERKARDKPLSFEERIHQAEKEGKTERVEPGRLRGLVDVIQKRAFNSKNFDLFLMLALRNIKARFPEAHSGITVDNLRQAYKDAGDLLRDGVLELWTVPAESLNPPGKESIPLRGKRINKYELGFFAAPGETTFPTDAGDIDASNLPFFVWRIDDRLYVTKPFFDALSGVDPKESSIFGEALLHDPLEDPRVAGRLGISAQNAHAFASLMTEGLSKDVWAALMDNDPARKDAWKLLRRIYNLGVPFGALPKDVQGAIEEKLLRTPGKGRADENVRLWVLHEFNTPEQKVGLLRYHPGVGATASRIYAMEELLNLGAEDLVYEALLRLLAKPAPREPYDPEALSDKALLESLAMRLYATAEISPEGHVFGDLAATVYDNLAWPAEPRLPKQFNAKADFLGELIEAGDLDASSVYRLAKDKSETVLLENILAYLSETYGWVPPSQKLEYYRAMLRDELGKAASGHPKDIKLMDVFLLQQLFDAEILGGLRSLPPAEKKKVPDALWTTLKEAADAGRPSLAALRAHDYAETQKRKYNGARSDAVQTAMKNIRTLRNKMSGPRFIDSRVPEGTLAQMEERQKIPVLVMVRVLERLSELLSGPQPQPKTPQLNNAVDSLHLSAA